jgi:hypothetical protein
VSVPEFSPIVKALLKEGSSDETKDVVALIGFVGPGRNGDVRLFPDLEFQRWMDVPTNAIVGHHALDSDDIRLTGRTVVWVKHEWVFEPVFKEDSLVDFADDFTGSWISTWPLIPHDRFVAAQLLDLVPSLTDRSEE